MNAGYLNIIQKLYPNAKIIIDRFHLVQLINRSMNKCRIHVMNQLRTSNNEDMKKYRQLNRYWKLILKKESELSSIEYKYYPLFGQRLETSVLEEMLAYDPVIKANTLSNPFKSNGNERFSTVGVKLRKSSSIFHFRL